MAYRKDIVLGNLQIAFPDKTDAEKHTIAKDFYHNLADTFVETIKLFSISEKELRKRCVANMEVVNDLFSSGKNVQLHGGHFFNWELINLATSLYLDHPLLAVYMPIRNQTFDRIFLKLRSRFGSILIPATKFKTAFHTYASEKYALGLIADQSAGHLGRAYWMPFFGKMTPFVTGPEKGARAMNCSVVISYFYKVKRGYYNLELTVLTTTPNEMQEGEITRLFIDHVERNIQRYPSNYLWSHRRWKWQYDEKIHGKPVFSTA